MHIRTQRLAICKELKKGSCVTPQLAEIMFYDPPDDPVLNAVITVGQNITEGNNAPVVPNFRKYLSINTREAVECFTDDLKFCSTAACVLRSVWYCSNVIPPTNRSSSSTLATMSFRQSRARSSIKSHAVFLNVRTETGLANSLPGEEIDRTPEGIL